MGAGNAAKRLIAGFCLMAIASAAGGIEKYVTPDGKVIYSDKAIPGAQSVKKLDPSAAESSEGPPRRGGSPPMGTAPKTGSSAGSAKEAQLDAALKGIRDASDALAAAKARLEAGLEPQENERQGTVSGRSRLNEKYFERIKQLEQDVEKAQERLNEAYRLRNNLR